MEERGANGYAECMNVLTDGKIYRNNVRLHQFASLD